MKIVIILIVGFFLLAICYFSYLAYQSNKKTPPGLSNNQLQHCPNTPNCLNSEFPDDSSHYIDALGYENKTIDEIRNIIRSSIESTGGSIINIQENYIAATYTSKLFRYVDDFETRIDHENTLIHFRSASRVGKSDFGANKKRILAIKNKIGLETNNK